MEKKFSKYFILNKLVEKSKIFLFSVYFLNLFLLLYPSQLNFNIFYYKKAQQLVSQKKKRFIT